MSKRSTVHAIVYTALMAAIVYVLTLLYVPLGESRVHCGNAARVSPSLPTQPALSTQIVTGNFCIQIS